MTKFRISWVQIMAIIALFGILLGVFGTAFLYNTAPVVPTVVSPTVSSEVTQ